MRMTMTSTLTTEQAESMLDAVDRTIKSFPDTKDRYTLKRKFALEKLLRNITAYEDNLVDILCTIRAMRKALVKEIKEVERVIR